MRRRLTVALVVVMSVAALLPRGAAAQDTTYYVGALVGVGTLSGDPSSVVTTEGFAFSTFKPETGPAVNVIVGAHLRDYVTVQANYISNRNDLALFSALVVDGASRFYEQPRTSAQHALVGDVFVYFRKRTSRIRPYLSTGIGVVRLRTARGSAPIDGGFPAPAPGFSSTDLILRSAVGIDVPVGRRWNIRYSFSEHIGPNPISAQLDPPGTRAMMNFQNLVGVFVGF